MPENIESQSKTFLQCPRFWTRALPRIIPIALLLVYLFQVYVMLYGIGSFEKEIWDETKQYCVIVRRTNKGATVGNYIPILGFMIEKWAYFEVKSSSGITACGLSSSIDDFNFDGVKLVVKQNRLFLEGRQELTWNGPLSENLNINK